MFTANNKATTLSGPPGTAVIETQEMGALQDRSIKSYAQRPQVSGLQSQEGSDSRIQVSLGYRNIQTNPVVYTPRRPVTRRGVSESRVNARYKRIEVSITGDFDYAIGVEDYGEQTAP